MAEKEYGEGVEGDWVSDFRLSIEKVEEGNLRVCAKVDNSIVCTLSEKGGIYYILSYSDIVLWLSSFLNPSGDFLRGFKWVGHRHTHIGELNVDLYICFI